MKYSKLTYVVCAAALLSIMGLQGADAETLLKLDARTQPAAPETGYFRMGTATSPNGDIIGINNRYLTMNGKPWIPVMGEFHYTRYPPRYWEEEIVKMKSAGVETQ